MPVLRFPFCLRRGSDLNALLAKQRLGFRLHAVCARFAGMVRQTVAANPELFLPVFLLFVWQITAIAVKPQNHHAWCAVETGRPNISRVRQRSANSKAASWASSYLSKL
jgi:hypothetical protein